MNLRLRLHPLAERLFAIDLRTLALFRVALGGVLAVDMLRRFTDLRAFYTDAGVLPRSWLAEIEGPWRVSLHAASGDAWWQALLLAVAVAAALALVVGWRARTAALVSWLLLASLCARNPLVLLGGDYLLCCLLFWSTFLPIGARFAVDAARSATPPPAGPRHLSWASAGLVLQVLSVYFFSALLKTGQEWWPDGTAVYYALSLDAYAWPWAHWIAGVPWLAQGLSWFVYWLELLGPLIALSPVFTRPLRTAVLLLIVLMQLGFLLLMAIGFFPFVSLTAASVLIGSGFWAFLDRRLRLGEGLTLFVDGSDPAAAARARALAVWLLLPRLAVRRVQDDARAAALHAAHPGRLLIDREDRAHRGAEALARLVCESPVWRPLAPLAGRVAATSSASPWRARCVRWLDRRLSELPLRFAAGTAAQGVAALVLVAALTWNLATVGRAPFASFQLLSPLLYPGRLEQFWQMFAPFPFKDNGWYVMPGKLADGSEVDVLRPRQALSYDKPWSVAFDFPDMRWQVYENRMYDRRFRLHRGYWARYLCREWNRDADDPKRLLSFNIVYMLERTPPPGEARHREQVVLWRHECLPNDSSRPPSPEGAATDLPTARPE